MPNHLYSHSVRLSYVWLSGWVLVVFTDDSLFLCYLWQSQAHAL